MKRQDEDNSRIMANHPVEIDPGFWADAFHTSPVPMFVLDQTGVHQCIREVLESGVEDFDAWLEVHPDFITRAVASLRILDVNNALMKLFRARDKEEIMTGLDRTIVPDSLAGIKSIFRAVASGARDYEGEGRYLTLAGEPIVVQHLAKFPAVDADPAIFVMTATEITPLKKNLLNLENHKNHIRGLLDNAPDILICHDLTGRITFINRAGLEMTGWPPDEAEGRDVFELLPESQREEARRRGRQRLSGDGRVLLYETAYIDRRGDEVPIEVCSTLLPASLTVMHDPQVLLMARDIRRRKKVEKERTAEDARHRNAQKLASLQVMAKGLANDFNNLLVVIMGNAELLRCDLSTTTKQDASVTAILNATLAAADLCRQLQGYTESQLSRRAGTDLNRLIENLERVLLMTIGSTAELRFELGPDLPPLRIDPAQIKQVIVNLVANSAESVTEGEGRITITTGVIDAGALEPGHLVSSTPPASGRHIYCRVTDNGAGIPPEAIERLFEPFFSLRSAGRGLGLSAALQVVQDLGGCFLVSSEADSDTSLTFLLPEAVQDTGSGGSVRVKEPDPVFELLRGKTILVVDDEAEVRRLIERCLRRFGCHVLSATGGREAIRIFGDRFQEVDAVILDMSMQGLDGSATCSRLKLIRADIPVVLTSGLAESDVLEQVRDLGVAGFLAKPFKQVQIGQILGEALRNPGASDSEWA